MIYNKFKQGFFRNFLAYVLIMVFLAITVLLAVFDHDPNRITISIIGFCVLMLFFVYDLFFSEVFIFKGDCFFTNKYPFNNPKYAPKLFKKISVQYKTIIKIEKRLLGKRRFALIIHFKEDEPLQYVFTHEDTRDFICDKLQEFCSSKKKYTHQMKLHPSPFAMIKSGQKTIELRLLDEKRRQIRVGDDIIFTNVESGETLCKTVAKLHRFDSFEELYRALPLLQCGYTAEDVHAAHPSDMEQYYSAEEQRKYGVVGIELD